MNRRVNPWRGLAGLPRVVWVLSAATLVNRSKKPARRPPPPQAFLFSRVKEPQREAA
jgi:hypothetical protein